MTHIRIIGEAKRRKLWRPHPGAIVIVTFAAMVVLGASMALAASRLSDLDHAYAAEARI